MSAENGKVCCNCRHCIRSRDEKYNIVVCRCDVHDMYLSYASVMGGCCKHWTKKQEGEETGGRVMSVIVRGMKMPENCLKCPMQFGGWCYVAPPEIDERVAPTVDEAAEQGKPKWCPLFELKDWREI